jgi:hypothetical protein
MFTRAVFASLLALSVSHLVQGVPVPNNESENCPAPVTVTVTANSGANTFAASSGSSSSSTTTGSEFGKCVSPEIEFAAGFGGRSDTAFRAVATQFFGAADHSNIDLVSSTICSDLKNTCGASSTAVALCAQASQAADRQKAGTGAQADAFNKVFGKTTNFNAVTPVSGSSSSSSSSSSGNSGSVSISQSSSGNTGSVSISQSSSGNSGSVSLVQSSPSGSSTGLVTVSTGGKKAGSGATKGKGGKGKGGKGKGDKGASSVAAATSTAAASTATNNNAAAGGSATDLSAAAAQNSTVLLESQVATGFFQNGQAVQEAGQVASLTSNNNFINFCATTNQPLSNGLQIATGSCNPAIMGQIPSTANMPSAKFQFPTNLATIAPNTAFTITMNIAGIETGNFVNADENYFAAPQQLNAQGQIIGHSHVVVEQLTSLSDTTPTNPENFFFFKGLNAAAVGGQLTADVSSGLPAGTYRLSSINTAANHQPCLVPVAQHGSLDDQVYFSVA